MISHQRLRDLVLESTYTSSDIGFVSSFLRPCLSCATSYRRGVAFFSLSSFATIQSSIIEFFNKGGVLRMVVSPILNRNDFNFFSDISADPPKRKMHSSLIVPLQLGKFQIKFAKPIEPLGPGIYHEKIGIFSDSSGDFVAFSGSLNDTYRAQYQNFERIHVFCSWKSEDQHRALDLLSHFEALWEGEVSGVEVCDYQAGLSWCTRFLEGNPAVGDEEAEDAMNLEAQDSGDGKNARLPSMPEGLKLGRHQTAAIANWTTARFHGIFEMATGSGKTVAALTASTLLARRSSGLLIVVVCPYTHLVDQWASEARFFGFSPIKCYGSRRSWQTSLARAKSLLSSGAERVVFVVTTMTTFAEDHFLAAIGSSADRLLIGDEVHGMGAPSQIAALRNAGDFKYRLGLSATPERWFDVEGTEALKEYFGQVVFHYTMKEALDEKVLVPYDYFPELIELTPQEAEEYQEITAKIGPMMFLNKGNVNGNSSGLTALLMRRARLIASAANKQIRLEELLAQMKSSNQVIDRTLIYCGDGTVETDSDDPNLDEQRQVEAVADLLTQRLDITCGIYVAETKLEQRHRLQEQLVAGQIQVIIAIRCLDEGVDIPPVRTAFILASSRNPRQFIQRRGRVLRRDVKSGKTHATIFDFIVIPPSTDNALAWKTEQALLREELRRVIEFSALARNEGVTLKRLRPLREKYNLLGFTGSDATLDHSE